MKKIIVALLFSSLYLSAQKPVTTSPTPSENQLRWQSMEMYAFIHYSLNTYTDQEWGFGNEDPKLFNPSSLDCRQWARVCKQAGMRGIIFTAKHHCGFCMWPSKYTEYSVKNSPWKNGQGDVVRELADACREEGLKFAVYLSPWDRNHPKYGQKEYVTYFRNQLRELLTNYGDIFEVWFDGANGGDGWYGGANEVRKIDRKTYYEWPETYRMIRELQPKCLIWNDGSDRGDLRWVGNEAGSVGETNWSLLNHDGDVTGDMLRHGVENGDSWVAAETNTSIRPGWFYHETENENVKSLSKLMDTYYKSVGRNSCLLLNFPIAPNGRIHPVDSLRGIAFNKMIQEVFKNDLSRQAKVSKEGNTMTYTFKNPTAMNRFLVEEDIAQGQRVRKFSLEAFIDGKWQPLKDELAEQGDGMTTIGHRRIICFPTIHATKIRFTVVDAKAAPVIKRIGFYLAPDINADTPDAGEKRASDYYIFFGADKMMFINLPQEQTVTAFRYLPPQDSRDGIVTHYRISATTDWNHWETLGEGEFSNIVNNPIWQTVNCRPTRAKVIRMEGIRLAQGDRMAYSDVEVISDKAQENVAAANVSKQPLVKTHIETGDVEGVLDGKDLAIYKAIPYAAPPVGNLRWKAPQPAKAWEGVLKADKFAPWPPQPTRQGLTTDMMSEDCLYLGIATPATSVDDRLPVMVWIHGGSFQTGHYGGDIWTSLARRGVVIVSIEYRTGALGFMAHPELTKESADGHSGNYGLLDQIYALKWVQRNIRNFGGDPSKVTIFGESAGAISCSILASSPLTKGLFHGVISQSGGSFAPWTDGPRTLVTNASRKGAEQHGLAFQQHLKKKSLKQMRQMSANELCGNDVGFGGFWPCVDGYVITDDLYRNYERGDYNDVPVIAMTNSDEGVLFTGNVEPADYEKTVRGIFGEMADEALKVYPGRTKEEAYFSYGDAFRDMGFAWPSFAWVSLQAQTGKAPAYAAYLSQPSELSMVGNKKRHGVSHADDIFYLNGAFLSRPDKYPVEAAVSEIIQQYWINFAKTGNPNGKGLPYWPSFDKDKPTTMQFCNGASLISVPNREQIDFVDRFYRMRREQTENQRKK